MRGKYSRRAVLANGVIRLKPGANLNRSMDAWVDGKKEDSETSHLSRLSGLEMAQRATEDNIRRIEEDIKLGTSVWTERRRNGGKTGRNYGLRSSYQA